MGDFLPALVTFILVVLILYLSYITSRYVGLRGSSLGGSKNMQVIDRLALGQDKAVFITRVGQRFLLLGVSSGNIQLLAELSEEEVQSLAVGTANPQTPNPFQDMYEKLLDRGKKKGQ